MAYQIEKDVLRAELDLPLDLDSIGPACEKIVVSAGATPCNIEWIRSARDFCLSRGIDFEFIPTGRNIYREHLEYWDKFICKHWYPVREICTLAELEALDRVEHHFVSGKRGLCDGATSSLNPISVNSLTRLALCSVI
jgi:hypothetical protein